LHRIRSRGSLSTRGHHFDTARSCPTIDEHLTEPIIDLDAAIRQPPLELVEDDHEGEHQWGASQRAEIRVALDPIEELRRKSSCSGSSRCSTLAGNSPVKSSVAWRSSISARSPRLHSAQLGSADSSRVSSTNKSTDAVKSGATSRKNRTSAAELARKYTKRSCASKRVGLDHRDDDQRADR
jgi:hypothetical protein